MNRNNRLDVVSFIRAMTVPADRDDFLRTLAQITSLPETSANNN